MEIGGTWFGGYMVIECLKDIGNSTICISIMLWIFELASYVSNGHVSPSKADGLLLANFQVIGSFIGQVLISGSKWYPKVP